MLLSQSTSMFMMPGALTPRMATASPTIDVSMRDRSSAMFGTQSMTDSALLREAWIHALEQWGFSPSHVEQYSRALADELVSLDQGEDLDEPQMKALRIRIGHRRDVRQAAAVARRSEANRAREGRGDMFSEAGDDEGGDDAAPPELHPGIKIGEGSVSPPSSVEPSQNGDGVEMAAPVLVLPSGQTILAGGPSSLNECERRNDAGVKWHALSGSCRTLGEFYHIVSEARTKHKYPKSFDRAFLDNKPMPFLDQDGVFTVVVLRIPDLTDEEGSTVATISNRLVIMFSAKHRHLLTYHRCDVDPLERLAADWDDGAHETSDIFKIVDAVNRCVMKVFRYGLRQLQEQSDALEDETDMVQMVEGLTLVQKKAAVYKRCLNTGRLVLEELQETRGLEDYIPLICETAQSYEAMMDEVAENAVGSINMQMALDGFHSSQNTKVFTYISLVCQPITLVTGWYGMNFVNMPELAYEDSYYVFISLALTLFFSLILFVRLKAESAGG
jgi:Mg2+ and Co2+ transporter CorA